MAITNKLVLSLGVLSVLALLLYIVLPKRDICADTIRGYKESANASFGAIRSGFDSLKGALGRESTFEVPQIEKLDALKLSVLQACDVQCRLLSECLRFMFLLHPRHVLGNTVACRTPKSELKACSSAYL